MLKVNKIKPKCDIVLYANNLFILDCVKPNIVPIIKDNTELSNKIKVHLKLKVNKQLIV